MSILRSFCPEPGGGTPWLRPLAGTLSTDEDTRPSPATTPTRIDNLGLLWVILKTAECTREQVISSGLSTITPDHSTMRVACKTSAAKAFDSKYVVDAFATGKRMIQGVEWLLNSEKEGPILWIDDDAGSDSNNQGCLSDFMVDDISGMAPSHAQSCDNSFEVANNLDCLHSSADLSNAGHALDAFCSKTVRSVKAPLFEHKQILGFNCEWNMYDRGNDVGNMAHDGDTASMAMRQYSCGQTVEMTELFKQDKMSSSSSEALRKIKHLSDLLAQLLSLLPYSALLMTFQPSEPGRQSLTEADVLKDTAAPENAIARALNLNGPQATTKCLTIVEHFDPLGDPG